MTENVESSLLRKKRTEEYLKKLGVPVNPHLPRIEDESECSLRSSADTARRALVLYLLVLTAHNMDDGKAADWLKHQGLWDFVSPNEKEFIQDENPSQKKVIDASWRAESLWTLLWATGKIESFGLPDGLCNTSQIQTIMPSLKDSSADFINQATLRPMSELLDESDLIYRIHWAVVEEGLHNRPFPNNFHPGVTYERHYALNWLTWYRDEWDDITTDT